MREGVEGGDRGEGGGKGGMEGGVEEGRGGGERGGKERRYGGRLKKVGKIYRNGWRVYRKRGKGEGGSVRVGE